MAEKFDIHGLDEVRRRLRSLPKKIRNRELGKAVRAGARIIRADAKLRAPVADEAITGKYPVIPGILKKNIAMRTYTGKRSGKNDVVVKVGVTSDKSGRKTGTDAFYWRFVEFGTSKMDAHPFLRPAFESNKYDAAAIIKKELAKGIQRQARTK